MGKLIFDLSDDERAALERIRIKLGLRSHAETLRAMIGIVDAKPSATAPTKPPPATMWRPHPKPGKK